MPWRTIPGVIGKVFEPDERAMPKKHPCKDCFACQNCSQERCDVCRGEKARACRASINPTRAKKQ